MNNIKISVFTPTYNRANYLTRAFQSLQKSTFKNFEWVIADDGSEDETTEIVKELISISDFPIKYFKFAHSGKMRTMNKGVQECIGEYFFELDSDDEITENALEDLLEVFENLKEKDKYYSVVGRCIYANGDLIGEKYSQEFNSYSKKKQNDKKYSWSCMSLIKTEILKKYPFPLSKDCNFIPEAVVWRKIALKYDQYYTNIICYKYHLMEDANSFSAKKTDPKPTYWYYIYFFNNIFPYDKNISVKEFVVYAASLSHAAIRCKFKLKRILSDLTTKSSKVLTTLSFFPMKIYYFMQVKFFKKDI